MKTYDFAEWQYESVHDTGNGALIHRHRSAQFPAVIGIRFTSYSRREENKSWFEVDGDPSRRHFATPEAAQREACTLAMMPDDVLKAELRRRGAAV